MKRRASDSAEETRPYKQARDAHSARLRQLTLDAAFPCGSAEAINRLLREQFEWNEARRKSWRVARCRINPVVSSRVVADERVHAQFMLAGLTNPGFVSVDRLLEAEGKLQNQASLLEDSSEVLARKFAFVLCSAAHMLLVSQINNAAINRDNGHAMFRLERDTTFEFRQLGLMMGYDRLAFAFPQGTWLPFLVAAHARSETKVEDIKVVSASKLPGIEPDDALDAELTSFLCPMQWASFYGAARPRELAQDILFNKSRTGLTALHREQVEDLIGSGQNELAWEGCILNDVRDTVEALRTFDNVLVDDSNDPRNLQLYESKLLGLRDLAEGQWNEIVEASKKS